MNTLLGGLDTATFLSEYWQRKPLLIRQAMPGFQSPLSAEQLAGLSLEPEIESRLILQTDTAPGWELRVGPFTEQAFSTLPADRWTLLIQDVEKHLPELVDVLDRFRFLPDWRIDDLMISHAAPGGSVGPHRDNYDVFLLQAQGERRWLIDQRTDVVHGEQADTPLKLVRDFRPTDTWILRPGDMLYLPPGIPHHGIAENDCQTWSIGFRASRMQELLGEMLDRLLEAQDPDTFLRDAGRAAVDHPAVIDETTLRAVRSQVRAALAVNDAMIDRWFAGHVTEPKAAFAGKRRHAEIDHAGLRARLLAGTVVIRNPASRIALLDQVTAAWLYADGSEWPLTGPALALARVLTDQRQIPLSTLEPLLREDDAVALLVNLINADHWFFADD
ncbi:MAG: cupin domain-containing protein [Aquisalimonadaceae bacterium]